MDKIVVSKFSIVLIAALFSITLSLFFAFLSWNYEKHLRDDMLAKISDEIAGNISINTSLASIKESCKTEVTNDVKEYVCNKLNKGEITSIEELKREMAKAIVDVYIKPKLDMAFRQFISNNNIGVVSLIALLMYILYLFVVRGSLVEDGMVLLGIWFLIAFLTFISFIYLINSVVESYGLNVLNLLKDEFYAAFGLASLITTLPLFGVIAVQRGMIRL